HGARERRPRHALPGRGRGGARRAGATRAQGGGAQGLCRSFPRPAFRRHASARGARARAQPADRYPADGRAVRGARRADPHDPRRGSLGAARRDPQDHRVRDPQLGRGGLPRRPRRGVLGAARHHQAGHHGRRAASAQARVRDVGEVHQAAQPALRAAARRDPQDHVGRERTARDAGSAVASVPRRRAGRIGVLANQVGFVAGVLVLWYLATERWGVSRLLRPHPVAVWHALVNVVATGEFLPDLRITLFEVAVAFAISATSGVMAGYLVSRSSFRTRVFEPLFAAMYAVPLILFLPLYVL